MSTLMRSRGDLAIAAYEAGLSQRRIARGIGRSRQLVSKAAIERQQELGRLGEWHALYDELSAGAIRAISWMAKERWSCLGGDWPSPLDVIGLMHSQRRESGRLYVEALLHCPCINRTIVAELEAWASKWTSEATPATISRR